MFVPQDHGVHTELQGGLYIALLFGGLAVALAILLWQIGQRAKS